MKFKINKKGFSLVELLVVLVIFGVLVIIGVSVYFINMERVTNKLIEVEEKELIDAASYYQKEFEYTDEYLSYTSINDKGEEVTKSCVSIQSLINKGFYKDNIKFFNENLDINKSVVEITKVDGISSYELINDYNYERDCLYNIYENKFSKDSIEISYDENGDNGVTVVGSIENRDDKTYILKLRFEADMSEEILNYTVPLYLLEVMDTSGSMNGTKYINARSASIELANGLIEKFNDSEVALINFAEDVSVKRTFSHSKLTASNFNSATGLTNILGGLDTAYSEMSKIENKKINDGKTEIEPIKYVIFLTDGYPELSVSSTHKYAACSSSTSYRNCATAIKSFSDNLKSVSNLVVIGYDISATARNYVSKADYQNMSSIDIDGTICPNSNYTDSNGKKHCYFDSNSSNISSLFSSISNSISEVVKSQSVGSSKINVKFNTFVSVYDMDGNLVNDINIDINVDDNNSTFVKDMEYTFTLGEIDENNLSCTSFNVCTYEDNLFDTFNIVLNDKNGNVLKEISLSGISVTITRTVNTYIN